MGVARALLGAALVTGGPTGTVNSVLAIENVLAWQVRVAYLRFSVEIKESFPL